MKRLSYVLLPKYPSGYTQQGGPASGAIAGQSGKMLQMQLLEMNNNINAIKEGAEQPFFLVNGLVFLPAVGGSVFTYGMPNITHYGYLREAVVYGSRSGSNSNGFQVKSISHTHYQVDFVGSGGGGANRGYRNLSDSKQYPGISIYQNTDKLDLTAVTLPGFGIYIGGGYSGRSLTRVMQHEYGHYLDYKLSPDLNFNGQGFTNFYLGIGLPSLFNAATGIGGSHSSYWTEIRANQWSEIWFGKNLDPDYLKLYPTK